MDTVRSMHPDDVPRVLEIYKMGIETGSATFETATPTFSAFNERFHMHSRFVFEEGQGVLGWVAIAPVSGRKAYSGVAEISIYVHPGHLRRGIASKLMAAVISSSEAHGIWTLTSSVFPQNVATLGLHEKFGFRVIGRRERIAVLQGQWQDTLILERRSARVGV